MTSVVCDCVIIFIDDDNRIKLKPVGGRADCQRDYINASYVNVSLSYHFELLKSNT